MGTASDRGDVRLARPHDPAEVDRLYEICLLTGDSGRGAERLHEDRRLLGELYVGPYLSYAPGLAFVLQGLGGAPIGYALGAADTEAFEERLEREWWPPLRRRYPTGCFPASPASDRLVAKIHAPSRANRAATAGFPAHLHVNILPAAQGTGGGRRLLEALFDALRERGVPGVHLGVAADNDNAIGFYRHLGFERRGTNLMVKAL